MQMIKVSSIIELLEYDLTDYGPGVQRWYLNTYPVGSKHAVLAFHPDTGEVEVCADQRRLNPDKWITFFPGEYKLVE